MIDARCCRLVAPLEERLQAAADVVEQSSNCGVSHNGMVDAAASAPFTVQKFMGELVQVGDQASGRR